LQSTSCTLGQIRHHIAASSSGERPRTSKPLPSCAASAAPPARRRSRWCWFDEAAVKAFDGFLTKLDVARRTAEGLEADWMGKGSGTVVRLAGVLELLAWSSSDAGGTPRRTGGAAVETAARLWSDYFRPQANLVFDRAGPTDLQRQARRVVRWLKANHRREVTREDVRCHALYRAVNAGRAEFVIGRLTAGGVLNFVVERGPRQAGRPARRWQVNPALLR